MNLSAYIYFPLEINWPHQQCHEGRIAMGTGTENIPQKILDAYKEKTPGSMAHQELAGRYLPGGDTRSATYFSPCG